MEIPEPSGACRDPLIFIKHAFNHAWRCFVARCTNCTIHLSCVSDSFLSSNDGPIHSHNYSTLRLTSVCCRFLPSKVSHQIFNNNTHPGKAALIITPWLNFILSFNQIFPYHISCSYWTISYKSDKHVWAPCYRYSCRICLYSLVVCLFAVTRWRFT